MAFNPSYPANPQTLGEEIRKIRMDMGLTAGHFGKMLNVTEGSILNWEVRGVKPTKENLMKLIELIGEDGQGKILNACSAQVEEYDEGISFTSE